MFHDQAAKVSGRILQLGRSESWVHLLDGGDEAVLIGGGMAHVVPELCQQLETFGVDENRIRAIVVLHAHFDHCGVVPFLKRRWPQAQVWASERARELLADDRVIASIDGLNRHLLELYGRASEGEAWGAAPFAGIRVERVLADGERLRCGDRTLEVLAVPGHSSCSIAVYVPEERALFGSDAGGLPFGDTVFTAANSNFDRYQESLAKMAAKPIDIYLPEHYGALSGEDCRRFWARTQQSARETRALLEDALDNRAGADLDRMAEDLTDRFLAQVPGNRMPRYIVALVVAQMLKNLAKHRTA